MFPRMQKNCLSSRMQKCIQRHTHTYMHTCNSWLGTEKGWFRLKKHRARVVILSPFTPSSSNFCQDDEDSEHGHRSELYSVKEEEGQETDGEEEDDEEEGGESVDGEDDEEDEGEGEEEGQEQEEYEEDDDDEEEEEEEEEEEDSGSEGSKNESPFKVCTGVVTSTCTDCIFSFCTLSSGCSSNCLLLHIPNPILIRLMNTSCVVVFFTSCVLAVHTQAAMKESMQKAATSWKS